MIIAGDYVPKGKAVRFDLPFAKDEIICANLEGPIADSSQRLMWQQQKKAGPHLASDELTLDGRTFAFVLANNHIMDYGAKGLDNTLRVLSKCECAHCGAGRNLETAQKPMVLTENGKRIGVISCAERQFGAAESKKSGYAELGMWLFDAVKQLKKNVDFVIVSCHAAFEHSPFPSPECSEFYRRLIDAGADVIHGHHAHVSQGWERYGNGVIFYGMGNFVVDPASWTEFYHRRSLVAKLDFSADTVGFEVEYCAVSEMNGEIVVALDKGEDREKFIGYVDQCNLAVKGTNLIDAWTAVSLLLFDKLYGMYLHAPGFKNTHALSWRNRLRYVFDGVESLFAAIVGRKRISKRAQQRGLALYNFCRCQSHLQVINAALGYYYGFVCIDESKLRKWLDWLLAEQIDHVG